MQYLEVFDNICADALIQRLTRRSVFDFRRETKKRGGRASRANAWALFSTLIGENTSFDRKK
ncbi:hypothetical protein [Thiomonas sp. FB-Cd]|uniref:hypothetical protein n=1 Tax=Thiomonas sp. FB-Cd TaxID=1158292 RepID=UPI0004DFC3E3|nr:hypothetical protein [Thiomonas sp. FB-Cd]